MEGMKHAVSSKFTILPLGFITVLLLVSVLAFAWWPSAQGSTPTVSHTSAEEGMFFYATGLLENIAPDADGCVLHVAVYEWRSLSAGFALEHIPQQNDRYALAANSDVCNAARMAIEAASGHVAFQARSVSGMWQVTERPTPAFGCGGLATKWRPPEL